MRKAQLAIAVMGVALAESNAGNLGHLFAASCEPELELKASAEYLEFKPAYDSILSVSRFVKDMYPNIQVTRELLP